MSILKLPPDVAAERAQMQRVARPLQAARRRPLPEAGPRVVDERPVAVELALRPVPTARRRRRAEARLALPRAIPGTRSP